MKKMKRYVWGLPLVLIALLGFAWSSLSRPAPQRGAALNGGGAEPAVTLSQATRGVVFYTAAINSDGTVASCFSCNPAATTHLGTGAYQVDFGTNVQATNGFSRWLQPDTLAAGSISTFCDTADRVGDTNAVFVNCQDATGAAVDTSFFLFVAR